MGDGSRRSNAQIAKTGIGKRKPTGKAKANGGGDVDIEQTLTVRKADNVRKTQPDTPSMDDHKDTTATDRKDTI